jgi:hypothetical protein
MKNKELKLSEELKKLDLSSCEIVDIIYLFEKYESKNLSIIDKLNRVRVLEQNRIKGGLKQTINAHGPIDKKLIGSATKRILGSLLSNEKPKKYKNIRPLLSGILLGILLSSLIIFIINFFL